MQAPTRVVLVTGASSGIGRATAELLARSGFRVLAAMRRRDGSPPVAAPASTVPMLLDVTCREQLCDALAQLREHCPEGLYGLVNNAGVAPPAAVELTDLDEMRRVLEVNTLAPVALIQACLPMLRKARGRIVNMSSMNGTVAMPMTGAYSASKFALEAISDALRIELRPWGISVSVIRPGQVRTAIFDKARAALEDRARDIPPELASGYEMLYSRAAKVTDHGAATGAAPDAVARTVLKALRARRPKPMYLVGLDALGVHLAHQTLPTRLMDWVMARVMGSTRLAPPAAVPPTAGPPPVIAPRDDLTALRPDTLRSS